MTQRTYAVLALATIVGFIVGFVVLLALDMGPRHPCPALGESCSDPWTEPQQSGHRRQK